jgi:DNA-directed RNA polymerase specialized sigma24 family protein
METSVIETVAKYFYFSTLNEQLTFACSFRVLGELKAGGWIEGQRRDRWIATLTKWRTKMRRTSPRDWDHFPNEKGFELPAGFKIEAWNNFLNNGEPSEVEAVLLSRILTFSDDEIAIGLGVTRGTVRYRVGRGLRHLGGYLES